MSPRISVIIPWRDRPELGASLAANLQLMDGWDVEIVVVNDGGDAAMLAPLLTNCTVPLRLVETRSAQFNKSRALNIGIHCARGRYLLLLDSDVILTDFDEGRARALVDGGGWVTLGKITESDPVSRQAGHIAQYASAFEIVLADQRRIRVETKRSFFDEDARSCPGIMFVSREDVVAIGGFNSALLGWGWEDVDLHVRLGLVLARQVVELGAGLHLTHGNDLRFFIGDSPGANNHRNQQLCMGRYNAGQFAGSYAQDVAALRFRSEPAA